jgi:hypothetical protein
MYQNVWPKLIGATGRSPREKNFLYIHNNFAVSVRKSVCLTVERWCFGDIVIILRTSDVNLPVGVALGVYVVVHVNGVRLSVNCSHQRAYCLSPDDIYQWYSTFFVCIPPDIISLQLCTPKVVGT